MTRVRAGAILALLAVVLPFVESTVGRGPASAEVTGLTWWAIGDSYSSGEGMSATAPPAGTDRDCARATGQNGASSAWAVVAHETLDDPDITRFAFTPCTGAISSDVPAQLDEAAEASGRDDADIVTLSMGGNDIFFAEVIAGCIDLSLSWDLVDLTPGCEVSEEQMRRRIDMLAGNAAPEDGEYRGRQLPKLYDSIAERVRPGGTVIVMGYPQVVEETARWDGWRRNVLMSCEGVQDYDVGMLRSVAGYLNQQIALQVQAADQRWSGRGVRFAWMDLATGVYETGEEAANRHGLCGAEPWINGRTLGIGSGDLRYLRSFHPTQAGHTATGIWLASWMRANLDLSTPPPAPDVRSIDLQNTTLPANSCDQDGWASSPPITVRNGEGTAGDEYADDDLARGYAEVYGVNVVGYADLDGDGSEDVVVRIGCSAGGTYGDQIVVPLTVEGESLALLGGSNIGAVSTAPEHLGLRDDYGGQRLARISGAALDGTAVVVDEVYDATGEEPNCCLTGQATMRWTWNGRWEATVVGG